MTATRVASRPLAVTLGALVRAAPRVRIAVLAGAALGAVVVLPRLAGHDGALVALQASAVALAAATVTLIDEPPLPAVPTSRARRRALLLGLGVPALALLWAALLALAGVHGAEAWALTLQLVTVTALALAGAARGGDPIAAVTAVALAFGLGRVVFGPDLFPAGTEAAHWSGATGWWAAAACAGLLWFAAHSRD